MSVQINNLIAQNKQEDAISLLLSQLPTHQVDIIQLSARFNSITREVIQGVVRGSEARVALNRINKSLLYYSNLVKDTTTITTTLEKIEPMNKLGVVNDIFDSIRKDLGNLNFSKMKIMQYVNQLNEVFESKIFSSFVDTLTSSHWDNMLKTEQTSLCKKVLENLLHNETKVKERMAQFQNKLNNNVSLDETIQMFFNRPSTQAWQNLKEQLETRFADTSLFGEKVLHAFSGWVTKLDALDDDLSFSMDFNFDYRSDFGQFLQTNLQPKNFNY